METMHHLVLWILVVCHYVWSSQHVDGGFSDWSSWSLCSVTCGNGTQKRNRSCTNPPPPNHGTPCRGPGQQTRTCASRIWPPIVHGGYSQWSNWSRCSQSCAGGAQSRSRTCTNPLPENGGRDCGKLGRATDLRKCNNHKCPVHGGYSQWSSWSRCTKSCGSGTQGRSRSCTNPPPANGGRDCSGLGQATELQRCNTHNCPVHGGYSRWSDWSRCSQSCGRGKEFRIRFCTNPWPAHGGRECSRLGPLTEIRTCNIQRCPVHGGFSQWSGWSRCSKSCEGGTQFRVRSCTNPSPANKGRDCIGPRTQERRCNTRRCPVHGGYSQWSSWSQCSRSCGRGKEYRYRFCTNPRSEYGGRDCGHIGPWRESRTCNIKRCPVHGGYSQWSGWSRCSQSCDRGTKYRYRSCTNPRPAYGGRGCSSLGPRRESQTCIARRCPVHGGYSQWSVWSQCTKTCGPGMEYRYRSCTNPWPVYGGRGCRSLGPREESRTCIIRRCPVHGGYSQWSDWSKCSRSCDAGRRDRYRFCTKPPPANEGRNCSDLGRAIELETCNTHSCPVAGRFLDWSSWSECSVTCGNGTQQRNRSCNNPPHVNNGTNCPGPVQETRTCSFQICKTPVINKHCRDLARSNMCIEWKSKGYCESSEHVQGQCPRTCRKCKQDISIDGGYTQWNMWSWCSEPCGGGTQKRSRSCTKPRPANGGKSCSVLGRAKQSRICNPFSCSVCRNAVDDAYCIKRKNGCSNNSKFRQYCKLTCNQCTVSDSNTKK